MIDRRSRIDVLLAARESAVRAARAELERTYASRPNSKQPTPKQWAIFEQSFASGFSAAIKLAQEGGHIKPTWR